MVAISDFFHDQENILFVRQENYILLFGLFDDWPRFSPSSLDSCDHRFTPLLRCLVFVASFEFFLLRPLRRLALDGHLNLS